jgi:hypothetical protein
MFTIFKYLNNIFGRNNKVNIETTTENKELENKKYDILNTILDFKILSISQVKIFKSLSKNSLIDLLNAFNLNQKNIIEIMEIEPKNDKNYNEYFDEINLKS